MTEAEAISEAVLRERQRCANIALGEKVDAESTGEDADYAYNLACDHIANAILDGERN